MNCAGLFDFFAILANSSLQNSRYSRFSLISFVEDALFADLDAEK